LYNSQKSEQSWFWCYQFCSYDLWTRDLWTSDHLIYYPLLSNTSCKCLWLNFNSANNQEIVFYLLFWLHLWNISPNKWHNYVWNVNMWCIVIKLTHLDFGAVNLARMIFNLACISLLSYVSLCIFVWLNFYFDKNI